MDINYQLDILEIEKLKLHEEIDYLQSQLHHQASQYCDQVLLKDQEIVNLQLQNKELQFFNQELLLKLQANKRNEDQLNNANYNFISLQKKLDTLQTENLNLNTKLTAITQQSNAYQQKWQRVSQQYKQLTNNKQQTKQLEQSFDKQSQENNTLKTKTVQLQLELQIQRQSEQEYKQSVQNKIQSLLDQIQAYEQQLQMMQQYISNKSQQCTQCSEYQQQINQLNDIVNSEQLQGEQNRINIQINQQLQEQHKDQYNKLMDLELQNHQLTKQLAQLQLLSESQVVKSIHQHQNQSYQSKQISNNINFMKLIKLTDQIRDPTQQELLKRTLNELATEIDSKQNLQLQLQEQRTMYDRLLVKYYSLQKSIGINEQESQSQQSQQSQSQSLQQQQQQQQQQSNTQPKKQQFDFLVDQVTTKQVKNKTGTPQTRKKEFQSSGKYNQFLSLDSSGYQNLKEIQKQF